ncbi:MAG: hypothetical protein ACFFDH_01135 [Promethearchaeota archaeon]
MGKIMGLYMQGLSDEEIMQQTGIDEETLTIIKERQGRMMERARQMSAMYGGSIPQQVSTPGTPLPGATTPGVTRPSVPMPPTPSPVKQRSKTKMFFRKKQVVIFLIGLALSGIGGLIMGFMTIEYTDMWWLIVLEVMALNIIFQIVFGIVAFQSKFRSRTYKAAAYADTDGDGKYDEAAFASKTVSGTTVKLKVLALTFLVFILITIGIFNQFGLSIQSIGPQTDITLGGDYVIYFFVLHSLGALIGGWGLTRG